MVLKLKGTRSSLIHKTWERCRSFSSSSNGNKNISATPKSQRKMRVGTVPEGCFSIYVGADRRRFVVKTSCINHPLFKMLLEEAEMEYGYNCDGPLVLPCDVHVFYNVLSEIEGDEIHQGCTTFAKRYHYLLSSGLD